LAARPRPVGNRYAAELTIAWQCKEARSYMLDRGLGRAPLVELTTGGSLLACRFHVNTNWAPLKRGDSTRTRTREHRGMTEGLPNRTNQRLTLVAQDGGDHPG